MEKDVPVAENAALEAMCPVCDAPPQEWCHVQPGVVRSESHFERNELASEAKVERLAQTRPYELLALQRNRRRLDNC